MNDSFTRRDRCHAAAVAAYHEQPVDTREALACSRPLTNDRRLAHDQLASAETGAEQRGPSPRTAVDARIDGGDVNLVTTSASGELQNHPEAWRQLPWVGESKTPKP
jgi:hypothetical protein